MKFSYRAVRKSSVVRGPFALLALTFIAVLAGCAGQPAPDSGAAGTASSSRVPALPLGSTVFHTSPPSPDGRPYPCCG